MAGHVYDNRSFWDHLEEFRWCLIKMVMVWFVGVLFCFSFSAAVIRHISEPVGQLVFLSPADALSIRFKVSFLLSVLLVAPIWVYQGGRFLYDGLKIKERKMLMGGCLCVAGMSLVGGLFADAVLMPIAVRFLLGFGNPSLVPMITLDHYVGFYTGLLAGCLLLFNFPFMLIGIAWQGWISDAWLRKYRRHIYVGCFAVGALLTPPDVMTQLMIAVPLCGLYEITLMIITVMMKGQRRTGAIFF